MRRSSRRRSRRRFPLKLLAVFCLALVLIVVMISCAQSDPVSVPGSSASSPAPSPSSSTPSSSTPSSSLPLESPSPSASTPSDDPAESPSPSASTPSADPSESPSSSADIPSPDPDASDSEIPWYLTLVNASHPLPENFQFETSALPNGLLFDSRAYAALMEMLNDCKAAGLQPLVCSAYRTIAKQTELFERKINKYMNQGYSYDEAYKVASTIVAIPGTSEHNLGLAVDICTTYYQVLDEGQEDTPEQAWLMEHCHEYGFILRYPSDKTELTGIIYEPWHYRYVGVEAATEIMSLGICFEEYHKLHFGET